MSFSTDVLKNEEQAIYNLRKLYKRFGYSLYKVSKFEEYDLYAHNKSFLVSQNVLTFTDTNGKLLALKPDVTLSITKNILDADTLMHKLYYNENVYRTSAENNGFREIMQTGLECIGKIDAYAEGEVVMLAIKSLATISGDYILDLSHMGFLEGLLDEANVQASDRADFMQLIESKNTHSLQMLCCQKGIAEAMQEKLCALTDLYLPVQKALPTLETLLCGKKTKEAYESIKSIAEMIAAYGLEDRLYLDFSIVTDVNYYDGISFKGFINGIPDSVLSGGRYDRLMARLGKKSGAVGFAVYLDRLERFENTSDRYDVDTVLLCDQDTDIKKVLAVQQQIMEEGKSVMTVNALNPALRFRRLLKLTNGGLEILEIND